MSPGRPITAICPGSFDPITSGHVDIIERASRLFDRVIVAVGVNPDKNPMFTLAERCEILETVCSEFSNVEVAELKGLLVNYAKSHGAQVIVKGLRAISDFEFEFQQALMNSHMEPEIETTFLMTRPEHTFLSSSLIKGVVALGGTITGLVPPYVERRLEEKMRDRAAGSLPSSQPSPTTATEPRSSGEEKETE
jgi:pantetheine-phosphate adenylyltransferase